MTNQPAVGTQVTVKCKGVWWRDGYSIATVETHVGMVVVPFPWLAGDSLCITSSDARIPVRSIRLNKILEIKSESGKIFEPIADKPSSNNSYVVKGSKGSTYVVTQKGGKWSCNCAAGSFGRVCRHIRERQG